MSENTMLAPLKKITVNAIGGLPSDFKGHEKGHEDYPYQVWGVVDKMTTGSTQFGEFIRFSGDFRAMRTADGKMFSSTSLILPQLAQDMLANAVAANPESKIEFGYLLGFRRTIKLDDGGNETGYGYEHICSPIVADQKAADPLADLTDRFRKALPAPSEAPTPAKSAKGK